MNLNASLPQPMNDTTGALTGMWWRYTAVTGLAAGLSGTVATSAVVDAWARFFEPKRLASD
jgi:hypothetical protein